MDYKISKNNITDTQNIVFETMQEKHLAEIAELERFCFGDSAWSYKLMLNELSDSAKHYFVAQKNDEVIGYIGYAHIVDEAHIMNLAVKADFRKKGIGGRLVSIILEDCVKRGIGSVTLEVKEGNIDSIALYEKFGFKLGGIRKKYYKNTHDALIYWKELK